MGTGTAHVGRMAISAAFISLLLGACGSSGGSSSSAGSASASNANATTGSANTGSAKSAVTAPGTGLSVGQTATVTHVVAGGITKVGWTGTDSYMTSPVTWSGS